MDSFGTNLRLSIRENQIYLAEPSDPTVPWITDKGRLFFDGLFEDNGLNNQTNWKEFFNSFSEILYFVDHFNLQKKNISSLIFVFDNISLETLNMLYIFKQSCSFVELKVAEKNKIENDLEVNYQLSSSTQKPKLQMSTLGLLVGVNTRHEGSLLNLNLRQRFLKGNFKLLSIGSSLDLTFPVYNLGSNIGILKSLGEGTHSTCQDIKNSEFPVLITNTEFYKREDSKVFNFVFKYINVLDTAWNGLNVLNVNLSSAGINSLNKFLPLLSSDINKFFGLYNINVSLSSISNIKVLTELYLLQNLNSTSVPKYMLSQSVNSNNELFFDKIKNKLANSYFHLPSNMVFEDNETYVNTQGLIKRMGKLLHFKKNAKTNWQLTRKLYSNTKSIMFYNNIKDNQLLQFDCVNSFNYKNYLSFHYSVTQNLTSLSYYLTKQNSPIVKSMNLPIKSTKTKLFNTKVKYWLDDFFNNNGRDSFSYNSSVLVNCSKIQRSSSTNFF